MNSVNLYNSKEGKLRISVTHSCQLHCQFCHREGIEKHWTQVHIPIAFITKLIQAYTSIGGMYVELTGGEPLCHPKIKQIIKIASEKTNKLIICTNGLFLNKIEKQLESGNIFQIKLSLHATKNSSESKYLLGEKWNFEILNKNIQKTLKTGTKIQFIFTHTKRNTSDLENVLKLIINWGADLQIVDLINSRDKDPKAELGYIGGEETEEIVSKFCGFKKLITNRTGSNLKLYEAKNGSNIEIKDYHYGLYHSRICENCSLINKCGEGIYALRVDSNGIFKPCLLRKDLECFSDVDYCSEGDIIKILKYLIDKMVEQ